MSNKEKAPRIFDEYISKMMHDKLAAMQSAIESIKETDSIDNVAEMLVDANSWVSLLCGDNEELYDDWRYRLFMTANGRAVVIQGHEVDVDFRGWMEAAKK